MYWPGCKPRARLHSGADMFALHIKPEKPEAHIQLLGTLFLICQKCRREGLMALEMDIERPRESDVFTRCV